MKVEKREVTVVQDVYIADDGTEYDDEDDCRSHDYYLNESRLCLYDSKLNRTDFDSCTYVKLITDDDVKRMLDLCEYNGIQSNGITEPGIYMYDDKVWVNLTNVIAEIYGGSHDQT